MMNNIKKYFEKENEKMNQLLLNKDFFGNFKTQLNSFIKNLENERNQKNKLN